MSRDVDFDDFCEIFDNEYIDEYVKRMNKEQVQRYFDKKEKQGTNKYSIAVILKENNKMIGNIGLKVIDEKVGNLSYVFNYKYWNKGYCSEACKTIINKAFSEWGFDEILADCEDYNIASKRILEKLGFEFLYKKSGDTLHHATHEPLTFLYFSLKNSTK